MNFLFDGMVFEVEGTPKTRLRVERDDFACNPRENYYHETHMVCWHRRYSLGDPHDYKCPSEFEEEMVLKIIGADKIVERCIQGDFWNYVQCDKTETGDYSFKFYDLSDYPQVISTERLKYSDCVRLLAEDIIDALPDAVLLDLLDASDEIKLMPLYLYDHSGISISTGDYGDPWDSGQIGWIYALKKEFEREGIPWEQAEKVMEGEAEEYDHYLQGNCWIGILEKQDEDGEWEEIDSCGGFIGDTTEETGILDHFGIETKEVFVSQ